MNNTTFVMMSHPDHPNEFLMVKYVGDDAHWMGNEGQWVAVPDSPEAMRALLSNIMGSGLLPQWDEDMGDD